MDYHFSPGTLIFLTPIDFTSIKYEGEDITILNISLSQSWISDRIVNDISSYAIIHNYPPHLCEQIFSELSNEREYSSTYVRFLLGCITIDAIRCAKTMNTYSGTPKDNSVISAALTYIHTHFRDDPTLITVSSHIGLSPNYLSKLFHAHIGKTFKAYVADLKLKYATTLLCQTDTAVTDICFLCGFNSFAHFLRSFKAKYGVSPTKYRQMNQLK